MRLVCLIPQSQQLIGPKSAVVDCTVKMINALQVSPLVLLALIPMNVLAEPLALIQNAPTCQLLHLVPLVLEEEATTIAPLDSSAVLMANVVPPLLTPLELMVEVALPTLTVLEAACVD